MNNVIDENKGEKPTLGSYLKYCSDDDSVIKGIFKDHKIRFTQPWGLNDPFELNPALRFNNNGSNYHRFRLNGVILPSEEFRLRHYLIERQINAFGILSLTKVIDSFDMWSRYSNGHKGFIIELKADFNSHPSMLSPKGQEYPIRKIDYVDEYFINIDDHVNENGLLQQKAINDKVFYTKLSHWTTEQEYRMVRPFSDLPGYKPISNKAHRDDAVYLFDFPLDCIGSVTFGACMSFQKKQRIIDACKDFRIEFLQAIIIRDQKDMSGKAGKVRLGSITDFPRFDSMMDFNFIAESLTLEDGEKIVEIYDLSELPYWKWNDAREWVQQYYRIRTQKD